MPLSPQNPRATVIVPTYNESANLPELVRRLCTGFPNILILIVDDSSPDGTADKARELAKDYPVSVIVRTEDRGLSQAVVRGFQDATTDICVVMDADLSHPPEAVRDLVEKVEGGADIAVGSRYVEGGDIPHWPLKRRLFSKAGTLLARPLTAARDPMAGFFCLRKSSLKDVKLQPRGFKILLEILARTGAKKIAEVPIRFEDREEGVSKFDRKQQKEYLRQLWALYRDVNPWPMKLAKFLFIGSTGMAVDLFILRTMVEKAHWTPNAGSCVSFAAAVTWNYFWNRMWTFRATATPVVSSFVFYTLGALGGFAARIGVQSTLIKTNIHYLFAAFLGIVAGTAFTFLTCQLLAFKKKP